MPPVRPVSLLPLALALAVGSCTDGPSRPVLVQPNEALLAKGGGGGAPSVQRIVVSPATATRDPGQTVQLAATALDRKGNVIGGVSFAWASSSAAIATVSASGLVSAVSPGTATISATGGGKTGTSTITVNAPPPPPPATETMIAAGDIAQCASTNDEATAALVATIPGTVAVLGDNVYNSGTAAEFTNCYDPSWGAFKARTKPSVGNHEYQTAGASGYYGYFGAAAGDPTKGYYSYDLGAWHVVVLNSNCTIVSCAVGSAQEQWLHADLAATTKACVLAYWHHPRFNSGASHGNNTSVAPFWDALYAAGAEVILNGHEHLYERFAPQTPSAVADPATGVRQFTVGTGGRAFYNLGTIQPNSQVRNNSTFGVLKLTLGAGSYAWQFIPVAGQTFTDSGTGTCH
ncbi:MAG: Ig-like domain-containing protein [Gemmatimonadetes bacterium]|nr:Ig-like domain-containing protein [Gemmatimonadota bacterium]